MGTNNSNDQQLNTLIDPVLSQDIPVGPSEKLIESTAKAMHAIPHDAKHQVKAKVGRLEATAVSPGKRKIWKRVWQSRWTRYGGLAAAILLLGTFTISSLLLDAMSERAFAEVIQNVARARSVQATVIQRIGRQPEIIGKLYMEENRIRFEMSGPKLVMVGDLERQDVLYLDSERKLAQTSSIDNRTAKEFANPIDKLRGIKLEDAEYVGEEYLGKVLAHVYRVKQDVLGIKPPKFNMVVWVDPESGLPVKIVNHDFNANVQHEIRFEDFVWNEPLSPSLFSLKTPEGYQAGNIVLSPPPASSKELAPPSKVEPAEFANGLLSNDRVPRRIVWGPNSATITATMCDPESTPPIDRKQSGLRQWNATTGELNWSVLGGSSFSLAASNDGKLLVTFQDNELQLRDPKTGKVTQKWSTNKLLTPLAISPDGKMLAAGISEWGDHGEVDQEEGGVQLWDLEQRKLIKSFPGDKVTKFVRFSKSGKYLANVTNGGSVKIWNVGSGKLVRILPYSSKFDFSPDDQFIACVASQPMPGDTRDDVKKRYDVQVYDLQKGKLVKTFVSDDHTDESWVLWIEFSPDGSLVAAANWDGTIKLWDFSTGELLKTVKHEGGTHSVVFAPNGKTMATGSEDKTLRLWNLDELAPRQ